MVRSVTALFLLLAHVASGAELRGQGQQLPPLNLQKISKDMMDALDPTKNGVFDKPETQDVLDQLVFPYLEKSLPGGLPKVDDKMVPSDQVKKLSKNDKLNVKLEAVGLKTLTELAYNNPQKVKDFALPKIADHVHRTWEGNNNTKDFYAAEQQKLFVYALERKGKLVQPFTEAELQSRQLLSGFAVIAPIAVWIALTAANAVYKSRKEVEGESQRLSEQAPMMQEKRFFPHLDGMRTVAAIIIIWFHYSGILGPYSLVAAQDNIVKPRYSPVSFFLVLSGFCMHYAYCKKVYRNIWDVLKYMGNRLGRVAPSYWVAWGIFCVVMHPKYSPFLKHDEWWVSRFNTAALWSFFMLQSWTEWSLDYTPQALTPTQALSGMRTSSGGAGYAGDFGNLWTISTLLLPWLAYPLLHAIVNGITRASPGIGLRVFTVLTYVLGVVPALVLYAKYGDELESRSVYTLKVNPIFLLPQFVLGMCAAQLLKQAEEKPETLAGIPKWINAAIADLSITLTFALVLAVPFKLFDHGFEVFFIGGEAHLIAAWLYFSCLPGAGKGVWTAFTGSPIMVKMGEYAMHVYLLQYPLAVIMDAAVNGLPADSRPPFTGWVGQLELIVGLWSMSVIFAEVLDKPMQRGLSYMLGSKQ